MPKPGIKLLKKGSAPRLKKNVMSVEPFRLFCLPLEIKTIKTANFTKLVYWAGGNRGSGQKDNLRHLYVRAGVPRLADLKYILWENTGLPSEQ